MNNSNDKSTILLETVIFDYVAGHLSGDKKRNFERQLEQDVTLQKAVDDERALVNSMSKIKSERPVPMSNFNELLSKIEDNNNIDSQGKVDNLQLDHENSDNVVTLPFKRARQYRIAASVAVFGLVGLLFANFLNDKTAPNFVTLSNEEASSEIKFTELASQGRLAKIVLLNDVDQAQATDLLDSYKLTKFESGSQQNIVYAFTQKAITTEDLALWRADPRVTQVNVFTEQ